MFEQTLKKLVLLLVLLSGALFLLGAKPAAAANPTTINFQGKVVNADGTNVSNGTYTFIFRLYNTASPTTTTACSSDSTCLFEETQSSVTVTNGVFQVELGSTCTGGLVASNTCTKSAAINFSTSNALYLTMKFNSDSAGFMSPTIHLTTVPYAYNADNLGGISASGFIQNNTSPQSSSNFNISGTGIAGTSFKSPLFTGSADIALRPGADTATAIQLQNAAGSSAILDVNTSNSRIGINTAAPSADLSFGNGASRTINVVTAASGSGNSLTVTAGAAAATNNTGGALALQGGAGAGTGTGGSVTIQGGANATGSGVGGEVDIYSGNAGGNNNSNVSGAIVINTPAPVNGSSGNITISTSSDYAQPGNIAVTAGNSTAGTGGTVSLNGGSGFTSGGGGISLTAGANSSTNAFTGGAVTLTAGQGGVANGAGGAISLTTGAGGGSGGTSGNLTLGTGASTGSSYGSILFTQGSNTVASISSSGAAKFENSTNGSGAFQVQNAGGNEILTVDTSATEANNFVRLGKASSINGRIVFNNSTNSNIVTLASGVTSSSYSLTLPTAGPSTSQCLQTDAATASQLVFGACSSGGDSISVNGSAATDANFIDSTASGTVAGTTWTLNTVPAPDTIAVSVSNASASVAGAVTTGSQTLAGNKTLTGNTTLTGSVLAENTTNSTTALQVQDAAGTSILTADTTGSGTITVSPAASTYSDEFSGSSVGAQWTTNHAASGGAWSEGSGVLNVTSDATNHDCWPTPALTNCAYLSEAAPSGPYQIDEKITTNPTNLQAYGIMAFQSSGNFLRYEYEFITGSGYELRFEKVMTNAAGVATGTADVLNFTGNGSAPTQPLYLRLNYNNDVWTPSFSTNGISYSSIGTTTLPFNITSIGPSYNGGTGAAAANGNYDYFRVTTNQAVLSTTGYTLFKPSTDTTDAVQIQDSATGSTLFNADTSNLRVGINTNAPNYTLDVAGSSGAYSENISGLNSTYTNEFNNANTNSGWSFINPLADASTADVNTSVPGELHIKVDPAHTTSTRDCYPASFQCLQYLEAGPSGDFQADTKLDTTPGSSQAMGIFVYQDSVSGGNYLRFEYQGPTGGSSINAYSIINGTPSAALLTCNPSSDAPIYLRVKRVSNNWYMYYSTNGTTFTQCGTTFIQAITVNKIGMHVDNAGSGAMTVADFDYFRVSTASTTSLSVQGNTSINGTLTLGNSTNSNTASIKAGATSSSYTWTLPTADAAGCLQSDGAGTLSIATCGGIQTKTITATGACTWTKPSGGILVMVDAFGAGGGGGGGGSNSGAVVRTGGSGGGGGAHATKSFNAADLGSSESCSVGAGGTHGSGASGAGGSGTDGSPGGNTTFGSTVRLAAGGGGGGAKGVASAAAGGGGGGGGSSETAITGIQGGTGGPGGGGAGGFPGIGTLATLGTGGAIGAITAGTGGVAEWGGAGGGGHTVGPSCGPGGTSLHGGGGGGAGGGVTSSPLVTAPCAGGASGTWDAINGGGGGAAGTSGASPTTPSAGASGSGTAIGGYGGGGGGSSATSNTAGATGAAGGAEGGGGGGGGAGTPSGGGGAGGDGGRGQLQIWTIEGTGADLAEIYGTTDSSIGPGDVVSLDSTMQAGVKKSTKPYESTAFGIISTAPSLVMGSLQDANATPVMVALSGRVPVKVDLENGPIKAGDYLTSSSTPGVAMKATKAGQIIGQAMVGFDSSSDSDSATGVIIAFVKNQVGNGSKLSDLITNGVGADGNPVPDLDKLALAQFMTNKDQLATDPDLSEITTDRLSAGLEVITPSVLTDAVTTNTVNPGSSGSVSFVLGDNGQLLIKDKNNGTSFSVDADGNAQFGLDLSVLGNIVGEGGLSVAGESQFSGEATFDSLAQFLSDVSIKGNVDANGRVTFNKDAGGEAVIKQGDTRVNIAFDNQYAANPIVAATLTAQPNTLPDGTIEDIKAKEQRLFNAGYSYLVSNVTTKGFTIVLNKQASEDLQFNWSAVAIKNPATAVSQADTNIGE